MKCGAHSHRHGQCIGESAKGSVGARGTSAAGMVPCKHILKFFIYALVARLQVQSKLDTLRDACKGQQKAGVPLLYG